MFLEQNRRSKRAVWRQWDCCNRQQDKVLSRLEQRTRRSGQRNDQTSLNKVCASRVSQWSEAGCDGWSAEGSFSCLCPIFVFLVAFVVIFSTSRIDGQQSTEYRVPLIGFMFSLSPQSPAGSCFDPNHSSDLRRRTWLYSSSLDSSLIEEQDIVYVFKRGRGSFSSLHTEIASDDPFLTLGHFTAFMNHTLFAVTM